MPSWYLRSRREAFLEVEAYRTCAVGGSCRYYRGVLGLRNRALAAGQLLRVTHLLSNAFAVTDGKRFVSSLLVEGPAFVVRDEHIDTHPFGPSITSD
jgi:hypothetical protein